MKTDNSKPVHTPWPPQSIALGVLCVLGTVLASLGYADTSTAAGAVEIDLLTRIFTGNIGLTIGLALAIVGLFSFIKGDTAGAITMFVLGIMITLLPGMYNGFRMIACPIAKSLGGHCGSETTSSG